MAKETPKQGFPKKWIGIGIAVLIILILAGTVWGSYNSLVRLNQGVDNAWANVETQYQRRFDLIPNLVDVTQKYATYEKQTLTEITSLRSQWQTQTTAQLEQSDNQFQTALRSILAIAENYPALKADTQFTSLQDNLAETENMVAVARTRFNGAVKDYNSAVQVFPSNVIAGWFGFKEKTYFKATSEGAENAPKVNLTLP